MKTLSLAMITIISIGSIVALSAFFIFNPIAKPVCIGGPGMCDVINIQQEKNDSADIPKVSDVTIPPGAEDPTSGKNYEPRYLVVMLGVNNTVKWTNKSPSAAHAIMADNHDDQTFWNATRSVNGAMLLPGKSFNFTFNQVGEFQYDTEPHPWMYGWVLVLPQSTQDAIQTVTLNSSSNIPDPCETFRLPCPLHTSNYTFTAQKFGPDIYIEKVTGNGVDNYAIIKQGNTCYYPPTYSNSCTNPDDLAILRLDGVDTSIPQENIHVSITGLAPSYAVGAPIDFGITVKGYGRCDIPSVLVTSRDGYFSWQGKVSWPADADACETGLQFLDKKYDIKYVGGPFSLNKTGTYRIHVGYSSNYTEAEFNVVPKTNVLSYVNPPQNNDSNQMITSTNTTGIIQLQNETFDFLVLNDTMKSYHNPALQTVFDGIQFALLPSPWSGGPPGGCGGNQFNAEAKFQDGTYTRLGIFIPEKPCTMNFTTSSIEWHNQTGVGLALQNDNVMLLVSKK